MFVGSGLQLHYCRHCSMCGFVKNQVWWLETRSRYDIMHISACIHDNNEVQRLYPRVRCLDYKKDCPTCELVRNQRWRPVTGSRYVIKHISACIHNSNNIPTAMPMFSGSGNKTRLLRRLLDVWICEGSHMAHINFRLTEAI